ncbi:AraC family transcriptional regulator [Paractinoplanes deccanensis]|uniref:AraC family transcriptional regulator n=1 Tax=Paractinoplanes deccanensis TaxID=113561 RepID=A0ABQ3Y725_9ACTN|nr:helix-turn-helix domain-containing protein [Actinoplanes deccanensis]GID75783.1 AraC family transcriptional regulator [Actinoplanes deccanensis]
MSAVDEYARCRPSARLRPYVAFYTGYRQRGLAPALHRGLPSPHLTLIFTIDDPLVVEAHPDPRQRPGSYDALIGGLHLGPALISHPGRQSGVQVALSPLGCRALLGLPAGELSCLDLPADAVLPSSAEIRERIGTARSWPERFAAVDRVLRRSVTGPGVAPALAYAWARLTRADVSVAAVAAEVGWSGRHLTDRFRAEFGLRPKEAARVARFDRARQALRPTARLADLAAACGYADQSHLVREFRALAGCTPSRLLADDFGFVQAMAQWAAHDEPYD